jgi:hypothetical protein
VTGRDGGERPVGEDLGSLHRDARIYGAREN